MAIVGAMLASSVHDARAAIIWPGEIARVERDLQAADVAQRRAAANRLAELPLATVERLLPLVFADTDPEVRLLGAAGARLVSATWSPPRAARIGEWLRDGDWRLRHAAAELLTRAPDVTAIADLVRSLGDSETVVRGQVVQALLATGHRDAVLPLLGRIDDPDPAVREQILLALSVLGDERAVLPLLGKLQDQRPSVRIGAARALGRL
ncbi:MAG TPA: HEAT repeat domain-containing protein, partial [Polyangiaceae bacterium]|nr:HEAT repeat domain-containing protein [Polyangiaceae bacterium]